MLTITLSFTPLSADKPRAFTWQCGHPKPDGWKDDYLHDIQQIEASGSEKSHIQETFVNLPRMAYDTKTAKLPTRWYGDHAKFIIGNLFR